MPADSRPVISPTNPAVVASAAGVGQAPEQVRQAALRWHHLAVLVDHCEPRGPGLVRRGRAEVAPVEDDAARVGAVDAGEDLDQSGLARAVLADEGVHLSR